VLLSDSNLGWAGLRATLESTGDVEVVLHATNPQQALSAVSGAHPDVILAAHELAGASMVPLLAEISRTSPDCRIVIVAERLDPACLLELGEAGATGFLLWEEMSWETLQHSLTAVLSGDALICSPAAAQALWSALTPVPAGPEVELTEREMAILRDLAAGRSQKEIAAAEGLSQRTLARALASLMHKLDAQTTFLLGLRAARFGLLRQSDD
jgi:DNA-binding NarL/FixJ family response regulator